MRFDHHTSIAINIDSYFTLILRFTNRTLFMESPLLKLNQSEWEALCDGCGRCCLVKLEDEDTGEVFYTDVACRYLDQETSRCTVYANRSTMNPDCVTLTKSNLPILNAMPSSCAYRRVHRKLSVVLDVTALRVSGRVISEEVVTDNELEDHIVDWISVDE